MCLGRLAGRLDGDQAADPDWFPLFEGYCERFGLGEGEVREADDGVVARFERDVVVTPEQVWAFLCEDAEPAVGADAPRRFGPAPPGRVTAVESARALDYDGVRWKLEPRIPGSLIVVEETLAAPRPEVLAAWQVHLELLVAGLAGIGRPWPEDRVAVLEARYAARYAALLRGVR